MQAIVEVACSSPPNAMSATKPAAQAVQAVDQDPFGLVLQKASEKIGIGKQSDSASKVSESKSSDKSSGKDSTTSSKVNESKNESEVKSNKPVKTENSEKDEESIKVEKTENESNDSDIVVGYIIPAIVATDNVIKESGLTDEGGVENAQAIQPAVIAQVAASAEGQTVAKINDQALSTETITTTETVETDAAVIKPSVPFAETLNNAAKGIESTSVDQEPTNVDPNLRMTDTVNLEATIASNKTQESEPKVVSKVVETASIVTTQEKPEVVDTAQNTAPPDTPDAMTGIAASGSVQTTTQISEPARLAEAPKSEVINQVANQIDTMVKTNRSSIRMQLYPEELGHIDLRIVTTKDGIGVTLVADKASTQQALKSEMEALRQSIEQAGIQLSNLNINQGHNSSRQQSFEHRQNFSKSSSYPGTNSENSSSLHDEPVAKLSTSVVDYRI